MLGATARVTLSALQVAGSVIAQQMGLGFVTSVDPTQGQQGLLIGNFLSLLGITLLFATDTHHLVIAALTTAMRCFRRARRWQAAMSPRSPPALRGRLQDRPATFCAVSGVRIGLQYRVGVLARLMPQMQVYFVGVPLSIFAGFLIFALVITALMGRFMDYFIGVMHDLIPLN